MGVDFRLLFYTADVATANGAAKEAFAKIKHLNSLMSDYDSGSELRRLCERAKPGRAVQVSGELMQVLVGSQELSERSGGAFDISVGPVVKLWRRARRRKQLPDPNKLQDALNRVGYQNVKLNPQKRTVELMTENMLLDLGGIAKGYAADEALKVLNRAGITRALIDASGDIVVGNPPPGKPSWRVEIGMGKEKTGTVLFLKKQAVATSGDAFQFIEIDGVRYSHIVNPKTGLGLTDRSTVTVIAPTGTIADSLASAVSVLGPQKGIQLVGQSKNVEVQIVRQRDGLIERYRSDGFCCFLVQ